MHLLATERDCLDRHLPGLDKQLADLALLDLEQPGGLAIGMFRDAGGPGLLVPDAHGGRGASPAEAVRVQRAIGARSPSLAVASAMHHFSVASLVELARAGEGLEWVLLQAIAEQNLLLSSGFAEGRTGQHILSPTMRAEPVEGGFVVTGAKKPCSLTWSMDLLSASVAVTDGDGPDRLAVVMVPATSAGIERRKFWGSWILAGAESDEIVLRDVFVPEQLVFFPEQGAGMDPVHTRGFIWFELLISASYLGAASALAERVISAGRGSDADRALLGIELETVMAALEHAAGTLHADAGERELGRALCIRFAVEQAVERVSMHAAALAGGMAFVSSSEVAYLLSATRALAYHPPSRAAASATLASALAGGPLEL